MSKLINFDFQGCSEHAMTVRDIIKAMGGKLNEETNKWEIDNDELMDVEPTTLEDDGMGYGVNEQYITEINCRNGACHLFIDKELENIDVWEQAGIIPNVTLIYEGKEWIPMVAEKGDDSDAILFWEFDIDKMKTKTCERKLFTVSEIQEMIKKQYGK